MYIFRAMALKSCCDLVSRFKLLVLVPVVILLALSGCSDTQKTTVDKDRITNSLKKSNQDIVDTLEEYQKSGMWDPGVVWFGHSLIRYPARRDHPALDIPLTVSQMHDLAGSSTNQPNAPISSLGFAEGPYNLGYWLDSYGDAKSKLSRLKKVPVRYVVGIGFMHLISDKSFQFPNLTYWLKRWAARRYQSPRLFTGHKYRFIHLAAEIFPEATWVNYIGPAFANKSETQPIINQRFECIRSVAESVGIEVVNVPVGPAIRLGEIELSKRPNLKFKFQQEDNLHLTAHGGLLASLVLFKKLFPEKPGDLPVPPQYQDHFKAGDDDPEVEFIQGIANRIVQEYQAEPCENTDLLPEDKRGRELLLSLGRGE